jgi:putative transposase
MKNEQKPAEEQLRQKWANVDADVEAEGETNNTIVQGLSEEERERLLVIQELLAAREQADYVSRQQAAAKKLGITVRSVRRLIQKCRLKGIAGVVRQARSDCGSSRISADWQKFILKTYREGNRNGQRMSPAQVAVRVKVRAQEMGSDDYPSHMSVYRLLQRVQKKLSQKQSVRSLGWKGSRLSIKTREGQEISVEWSNQVWQCDHTKVDVLVVDQIGEILGRPWLTTVIDTYSRCVVGMHLGFDAPSAEVVCLALRHAILPKQYSGAYELQQSWDSYGIPQYLYTDGGKDFKSQHVEQVATELGIVCCLRRKPSDGGIVERPFGTFNSELFSTLPGYTGSDISQRPAVAEEQACISLQDLEKLLVRYIVDRYNQSIDARMGGQTRIGRWLAGCIAQPDLLGERELDICLMRRARRIVYRGGYIQFANLTYRGEHLAGYAGNSMVIRYNPRDITTILIYQVQGALEEFLARAHAVGLETESLSYAEAVALSRRLRQAGSIVTNQSLLTEVRDRDATVKKLLGQNKKKPKAMDRSRQVEDKKPATNTLVEQNSVRRQTSLPEIETSVESQDNRKPRAKQPLPVPNVRVFDYEQLKREAGF